jgi:effector-binding domain-containing protein
MEIDFGIETPKAFEAAGAVKCVSTPEGRVAMATHLGPLKTLSQTHMAIHQWCAANGHGIGGYSWETYEWGAGPDPVKTEVRYLLG